MKSLKHPALPITEWHTEALRGSNSDIGTKLARSLHFCQSQEVRGTNSQGASFLCLGKELGEIMQCTRCIRVLDADTSIAGEVGYCFPFPNHKLNTKPLSAGGTDCDNIL